MIEARAYILRKKGVVPELESVFVDERLAPGQVLVKMVQVGLCATQIHEIFESTRNSHFMPHLLGHEGVGVVMGTGPGVKGLVLGDKCILHWRPSSKGLDASPGSYKSPSEKLGAGKTVAFSEMVVVPENRLTHMPEGLSDTAGVLMGCSFTTGWGSVRKVADSSKHNTVVVVGLGTVGASAAHTASSSGLEVIGIDPRPLSSRTRRMLGLQHSFASIEEMVLGLGNNGLMVKPSLVVETTGLRSIIEDSQELLEQFGQLVLVGMPKGGLPKLNVQKMLDGLEIKGSNGGSVDPATDFSAVAPFARSFYQKLSSEVAIFDFDSLAEAVSNHRTGKTIKSVLVFTQP